MEIVIDIPEEYYKSLLENCRFSSEEIPEVSLAIATGTLLPKGHGNLKDVDPIIDELQRTRTYSLQQAIDIETFKKELINAPTIVKAECEET